MKISILIPVYNEEVTISQLIEKILNVDINKEIILVNDGSTDNTLKIIHKFEDKIDKIISHKKNQGKGSAIKTAKKFATGDIIIIQDGDLEYDPIDYKILIEPILNNKSKVVYGSRVLDKKRYIDTNFISFFRTFGNHILTIISNIVNKQILTDAHTCYKVFAKEIFSKIELEEDDFSFCPEITTKLANLGIKIIEVPINYNGRTVQEGKKIKFQDAIKAIKVIFKYKFFEK